MASRPDQTPVVASSRAGEPPRETIDAAHSPYAEVRETLTAIVFLVGDRAFKLKKPVRFGFLDFTDRDVRRHACERETALNARLAPDVYLGVSDVVGPGGEAIDHLVEMRRLPDDRQLTHLVAAGEAGEGVRDSLREVAAALARFHGSAARSAWIDDTATSAALRERWEANAAEMAEAMRLLGEVGRSEAVLARAERFLEGRSALFGARIAAGRVCDGHGDLLCDDVFCLSDGPRLLDCLDFDDRLRVGDGLADAASLAMDLERLGHPAHARSFLASYREFAGDDWPDALVHHYVAYRAQVRAKVAALRHLQGDPGAARSSCELLQQAQRHLDWARTRLVMVGGLPGTGKSTLARGIAEALGAVLLRSDEVRADRLGVDGSIPGPMQLDTGAHAPAARAAVYDELLERAGGCLRDGRSVVLDATFAEPRWRATARTLAEYASADVDEVRCSAPLALLEARVTARRGDASQATADVVRAMAVRDVPWPSAYTVDTTGPAPAVHQEALEHLSVDPERGWCERGTPSR